MRKSKSFTGFHLYPAKEKQQQLGKKWNFYLNPHNSKVCYFDAFYFLGNGGDRANKEWKVKKMEEN